MKLDLSVIAHLSVRVCNDQTVNESDATVDNDVCPGCQHGAKPLPSVRSPRERDRFRGGEDDDKITATCAIVSIRT